MIYKYRVTSQNVTNISQPVDLALEVSRFYNILVAAAIAALNVGSKYKTVPEEYSLGQLYSHSIVVVPEKRTMIMYKSFAMLEAHWSSMQRGFT